MELLGDYQKETGAADGLREALLGSGRDFLDYDPVGLPDAEDVRNIIAIINNFKRIHPGVVEHIVKEARDEKGQHEAANPFAKKKNEVRRRVLSMPTPLLRQIEEAYPLMFANRKHLQWFKANFPLFVTG